MLRGCVDAITHRQVLGWACDDERPNQIQWVCIFVDGHKIADVECSAARSDLRSLGTYGDGNHGIEFWFPEPLPDGADRRVTVYFSASGKRVPDGDVVLRTNGTTTSVVRGSDTFMTEPEQLPFPRDPRRLFEMLSLLEENRYLHDLLGRIDFGDVGPKQIRFAVYGDMAAQLSLDEGFGANYSAWADIDHQLRTRRFWANIIPLFLRAYPEKQRLIFVHVPKCAGTDLYVKLKQRLPLLHEQMMYADRFEMDLLFYALSRLALSVRFFDEILVSGHIRLSFYMDHQLIRPIDKAFTILRDPIEIAVSHVNYVITRIQADARAGQFLPDTKGWMEALHIESVPDVLSDSMIGALCHDILHNPQIVRPNTTCYWLGAQTAKAAHKNLADNDVEVTITENYNRWLAEAWGITSTTRMNESESFTSIYKMPSEDVSYIRDIFAEDFELYGKITDTLGRTGKLSLTGRDLQ